MPFNVDYASVIDRCTIAVHNECGRQSSLLTPRFRRKWSSSLRVMTHTGQALAYVEVAVGSQFSVVATNVLTRSDEDYFPYDSAALRLNRSSF
jgi:hypothetical protein